MGAASSFPRQSNMPLLYPSKVAAMLASQLLCGLHVAMGQCDSPGALLIPHNAGTMTFPWHCPATWQGTWAQPWCAGSTGLQYTVSHLLFFFLKFFLFLNFMLILGHDSVFSMTVASTRTRSFLEREEKHHHDSAPPRLPSSFTHRL